MWEEVHFKWFGTTSSSIHILYSLQHEFCNLCLHPIHCNANWIYGNAFWNVFNNFGCGWTGIECEAALFDVDSSMGLVSLHRRVEVACWLLFTWYIYAWPTHPEKEIKCRKSELQTNSLDHHANRNSIRRLDSSSSSAAPPCLAYTFHWDWSGRVFLPVYLQ